MKESKAPATLAVTTTTITKILAARPGETDECSTVATADTRNVSEMTSMRNIKSVKMGIWTQIVVTVRAGREPIIWKKWKKVGDVGTDSVSIPGKSATAKKTVRMGAMRAGRNILDVTAFLTIQSPAASASVGRNMNLVPLTRVFVSRRTSELLRPVTVGTATRTGASGDVTTGAVLSGANFVTELKTAKMGAMRRRMKAARCILTTGSVL